MEIEVASPPAARPDQVPRRFEAASVTHPAFSQDAGRSGSSPTGRAVEQDELLKVSTYMAKTLAVLLASPVRTGNPGMSDQRMNRDGRSRTTCPLLRIRTARSCKAGPPPRTPSVYGLSPLVLLLNEAPSRGLTQCCASFLLGRVDP